MKTLVLALTLATLSSNQSFADSREALGLSMAPTVYSAMFPVMSTFSCEAVKYQSLCVYAMSTSYGMSTTALFKEEMKNVEVDAYDFLAGETMTIALREVIHRFRLTVQEAQDLSDEEVIAFLLSSL